MSLSLPRLSLLALALAACTSTADLPGQSEPTGSQTTIYAVTAGASPLASCEDPIVADVLRAPLVDLRGERLLLLQLATTPAVQLRPPGACSSVSGACGHFKVDLYEGDAEVPSTMYTSSAVVELPVAADVATVQVRATLLDDVGGEVEDTAGQVVSTGLLTVDVFAPGDPLCVAAADGG